jgi:IS1 family transposase
MNKLSIEDQTKIIRCLVEGNSIRGTARITDNSPVTVLKLLGEVGQVCQTFQRENIKGLQAKRIQCDEVWDYCYAKEKNVPKEFKGIFGFGDVWTFTALDQDTKLCIAWLVGPRTTEMAVKFFLDLRQRVEGRPQISTDAFNGYERAMEAFKGSVDYGSITKIYGKPWAQAWKYPDRRYSPGTVTAVIKKPVKGNPKFDDICTSHVERANLTMRMGMKRFARLSNGFSKKLEKMEAAIALHFMFYNYCRVHLSLQKTPAQAAGLSDKVWTLEDVLMLLQVKTKAA